MKNIKIQIPTNHEIDQEKSDLSKGLVCFKEVKKQLPTRWEGKDLTKEAEKEAEKRWDLWTLGLEERTAFLQGVKWYQEQLKTK